MSTVHFLNVKPGDCTIIQHNSGNVSMVDICCGNIAVPVTQSLAEFQKRAVMGNFRMCESPTCPIDYLSSINVKSLFRFILTHPDMDHMDGFDALVRNYSIGNFWDSGLRRPKPSFGGGGYLEKDWDTYEDVRDGKKATSSKTRQAGDRFPFANQAEGGGSGGDGMYILSPDKGVVAAATADGDHNDGSYVLLYRSVGGRIIIPGDAHDNTWKYVIENHKSDIEGAAILIAPHHGRGSGRSYDFLDVIKPKLTLFGCGPSEHLDYDAWGRRNLSKFTSNQCGNIVMESDSNGIEIWIENETFANAYHVSPPKTTGRKNARGYNYLTTINES
jgi:competence protein ComEC